MRTVLLIVVLAAAALVGYTYLMPMLSDSPEPVGTASEPAPAPETGDDAATMPSESATADDASEAPATESADSDVAAVDLSVGEDLFDQYCTSCHGADALGLSGFSGERERFDTAVGGGIPVMPDFTGMFSDEELASLFEYVKSKTQS